MPQLEGQQVEGGTYRLRSEQLGITHSEGGTCAHGASVQSPLGLFLPKNNAAFPQVRPKHRLFKLALKRRAKSSDIPDTPPPTVISELTTQHEEQL